MVFSGLAAVAFVVYVLDDSFSLFKAFEIPTDLSTLFGSGIGSAQPYAIIQAGRLAVLGPGTQFWAAIFLGNCAQLGVAILYFLVTGLIAVMAIANEWSRFVVERKTLRVSFPHGIQRSSYFLALPYRLSIPLMAGMAILHWLISQSIFVIATETYIYAGTEAAEPLARIPQNDSYLVGFSSPGSMLSVALGTSLLIWTGVLGIANKLEGIEVDGVGTKLHMPLASSCSAAISAACHRPEDDSAAHLLPVVWGKVPDSDQWCFTSAKYVEHTM